MQLPNTIESKPAARWPYASGSLTAGRLHYFEAVIPKARTPPHATGLHSARAPATRSPISRCADRILSAEARRRPRTSLSFDSLQLTRLVGSLYHGLTPLR